MVLYKGIIIHTTIYHFGVLGLDFNTFPKIVSQSVHLMLGNRSSFVTFSRSLIFIHNSIGTFFVHSGFPSERRSANVIMGTVNCTMCLDRGSHGQSILCTSPLATMKGEPMCIICYPTTQTICPMESS